MELISAAEFPWTGGRTQRYGYIFDDIKKLQPVPDGADEKKFKGLKVTFTTPEAAETARRAVNTWKKRHEKEMRVICAVRESCLYIMRKPVIPSQDEEQQVKAG